MADVTWLAAVLRDAGLHVWESPGWQRRGHGTMRPIVGILAHHTAGGGVNDWKVVQNGRPGLSGPLAQLVLERNGMIRVIAAGVSWHAGSGGHPALPGASNANLIGIEGVSTGRWNDWTAAQRDVYPRMTAAILRHLRLPVSRAVAHKEWAPSRKIDPSFDMGWFRNEVSRHLRGGGTTPPPAPGGLETLAFTDKFRDWAGNEQTVLSWMNLQDKRGYEAVTEQDVREIVREEIMHKLVPVQGEGTRGGVTNLWSTLGWFDKSHLADREAVAAAEDRIVARLAAIEAKLDANPNP